MNNAIINDSQYQFNKIALEDGTEYNVCDKTARDAVKNALLCILTNNLKFYSTKEEYENDKAVWNYIRPNISLITNYNGETNKIIYNQNFGLYDILWVKESDTTVKRVTHDILNPNEGYKPIALRVIGENFLGDNEPSRWMSLKYMYFDNMSTTETSTRPFVENAKVGSLTKVGMTWDEPVLYTPRNSTYTQEQLNNSRFKSEWASVKYSWPDLLFSNGINDEANFQNTTHVSKQYDWAYLPSDTFNNYYTTEGAIGTKNPLPNELFYVDTLRGWYNNAVTSSRFLPSLYTEDDQWVVGANMSDFTYPTHALTRIHGKDVTSKVISEYFGGAPNDTSSVTYIGKCDYQTRLEQLKPFYCCSQYRTIGTNAGDWYLPAIGELAFIIPDLKHIRERLADISELYPDDCMSTLVGAFYWSSTDYRWDQAWSIRNDTGEIHYYYKSFQFMVLAFLQYSA